MISIFFFFWELPDMDVIQLSYRILNNQFIESLASLKNPWSHKREKKKKQPWSSEVGLLQAE